MSRNDVKQRGRSGARGIKNVDKVQDKEIFAATFTDENGKVVRLGKSRLSHEIVNLLSKIALETKITRSELIRVVLEDFIKYYYEAKAVGGKQVFTASISIEAWLQERNDFVVLLNEIKKQASYLEESKSPEVKILSRQINLLAQMLNLTNKNVI